MQKHSETVRMAEDVLMKDVVDKHPNIQIQIKAPFFNYILGQRSHKGEFMNISRSYQSLTPATPSASVNVTAGPSVTVNQSYYSRMTKPDVSRAAASRSGSQNISSTRPTSALLEYQNRSQIP